MLAFAGQAGTEAKADHDGSDHRAFNKGAARARMLISPANASGSRQGEKRLPRLASVPVEHVLNATVRERLRKPYAHAVKRRLGCASSLKTGASDDRLLQCCSGFNDGRPVASPRWRHAWDRRTA